MATQIISTEQEIKSKRPSDSAFKQQRLPAWEPVLTARTVLPIFFIIGIIFIPIGVVLRHFSNDVNEIIVDYTKCTEKVTNESCADNVSIRFAKSCICEIDFSLDKPFLGDVYMYYGLSNFYQNHRLYVKSRDDDQLLGILSKDPSHDCNPFSFSDDGKPIAPCGAIANSIFNDTFTITYKAENISVPFLKDGIAWPSDKRIKFRNPEGDLKKALENYDKPMTWQKYLWELDSNDENNGFQNEDLIVWMRTAALPTFRKLYRRVDRKIGYFQDGLREGNYTLTVNYMYPVSKFDGSKRMILTTMSLLGGKNPFLGIAYIVIGSICLLLGLIFLFMHISRWKSGAGANVNPHAHHS